MKFELYPPLFVYEQGQRPNQEDSLWPKSASSNDRLFIICDGMGGHENGEVASQTVCSSLGRWFKEHVNPQEPFTDEQLYDALEYAYTELDQFADGSIRQMGTTLTLIYLHSHGVTAAHIGDSRIYHIRPISTHVEEGLRNILYRSRDHSLVFDLFQAGEITYEEMMSSSQKNIITRAMTPGEGNRTHPDIIHITDIQPDDYFILCSDGMLEQMSDEELVNLLSDNYSDKKIQQQLVAATANNQDNHTAWIIHIKAATHEKGDELLINEEPTARCNAVNFIPSPQEHEINQMKDDVIVVSTPPTSKKKTHQRWGLIAILLFAISLLATAVWLLFLRN